VRPSHPQRVRALLAALVLALVAFALALDASAALGAAADHDDDFDDTVQVHVPERLRGSEYRLVVDGREYSLAGKSVDVDDSDYMEEVELVARDGRVVSHTRNFVDRGLFDGLRPRYFRASFGLGGVEIPRSEARAALAPSAMAGSSVALDAHYGPVGLRAAYLSADSSVERFGRAALGRSFYLRERRVGVTVEAAPLTRLRVGGLLRRISLLGLGGVGWAHHHAALDDGDVQIRSDGVGRTWFAGGQMTLRIVENIRAEFTVDTSSGRIALPELGYDRNTRVLSTMLGASYAF
jgi:hypothetical protein